MTRSRLDPLPALVIFLIVAVTVLGVAAFDDQFTERVSDRFQPAATANEEVLVVTLGPAMTARSEFDAGATFSQLRSSLDGARTVVIEPDVLRMLQTHLATGDVQQNTWSYPFDLETVEKLESAVTASVVGSLIDRGEPLLRLDRPIPRTSIAAASIATGFATPVPVDPRRPVRLVPLLAQRADNDTGTGVLPSLSLAAVLAHRRSGSVLSPQVGSELVLDERVVTTEGPHLLRVNFAAALLAGGDQVIAASELIASDDPAVLVRDRLVFVGATDPAYAQLFPTPVGGAGRVPLVYVDANAANTILTESYLRPESKSLGVVIGLVLAALIVALGLRARVAVTVGAMAVAVLATWRFGDARVDAGSPFDLVAAELGILASGILALGWRIVGVVRARRRTAALFSRYVPDAVASELLFSAEAETQSAVREVATFFCDLRGFTALAAEAAPDVVRRVLNDYYEYVAGAVLDAGGTVIQFVGDEVFGVFGAPLPNAGAHEALAVAAEVLTGMEELQKLMTTSDLPPVSYGIGLHCGPVVTAHVGTARRRQYTVVGDTVNVGSRLCGQAGGGEAVMSEEFWLAVGQPQADDLGALDLKGMSREIRGKLLRFAEPIGLELLPATSPGWLASDGSVPPQAPT